MRVAEDGTMRYSPDPLQTGNGGGSKQVLVHTANHLALDGARRIMAYMTGSIVSGLVAAGVLVWFICPG